MDYGICIETDPCSHSLTGNVCQNQALCRRNMKRASEWSQQLETEAQDIYNKKVQKDAEVAELADAADSKSVAP